VSLVCFDFAAELRLLKPFTGLDVQKVKEIGVQEYSPEGGTPLLDAIGVTLTEATFPAKEKVLVIITTDGEENQSHHWTNERVQALCEEKEKLGWEFMYFGVGLDAFKSSGSFSTASMRAATVSSSGNRVMAGLIYEQGASQGYQAMRHGMKASHAVASMVGSHEYDSMIDRSQPGMSIADVPTIAEVAALKAAVHSKKAPKAKK
jgi:hypothetical protein